MVQGHSHIKSRSPQTKSESLNLTLNPIIIPNPISTPHLLLLRGHLVPQHGGLRLAGTRHAAQLQRLHLHRPQVALHQAQLLLQGRGDEVSLRLWQNLSSLVCSLLSLQ